MKELENWEKKKLKHIVSIQKGKVPKEMITTNSNKELPVYLTMDYLRGESKKIYYVPDYEKYILIEDKEILLLWDGSNAGEFLWSKKGVLSSTMAVVKPNDTINKQFLFYRFKDFERYLKDITVGMGIPHVNPQEFLNFSFFIPSLNEQSLIANYLDHKTAEIDELIAKKEHLLELYEEEKKAIINRAVTKGINPNVKMKDSGIPWLGEIPEHWEVKKLKYVVSKIGSGITPKGGANVYKLSGIPLLRSQNIHFNGLKLDDVAYISKEIHDSMSNSKVKPGDVLLNITGASIGRCYFVENDLGEANVNQHVCIIRPQNIDTKFLYYILRSNIGQKQIVLEQTGSGREGLNFEVLRNFFIPTTSLQEQQQIVSHIEKQLSLIDSKIEKTKKVIELLKDIKQARGVIAFNINEFNREENDEFFSWFSDLVYECL